MNHVTKDDNPNRTTSPDVKFVKELHGDEIHTRNTHIYNRRFANRSALQRKKIMRCSEISPTSLLTEVKNLICRIPRAS
jgi:hypothetical protein